MALERTDSGRGPRADYPQIGERLRERRHELGLSQEELADRADLHRTYISSLEQGRRNVAVRNLVRLAEALDFDPAELVRGLRSY